MIATYRRKDFAALILYLCLAGLTVKDLQEFGGIRVISTLFPFVLLALYPTTRHRVPLPVLAYTICFCFLLSIQSLNIRRAWAIYEAYLIVAALGAVVLLSTYGSGLGRNLHLLGEDYANVLVVMCLLCVITLQKQWFGGYAIRTFSDFAPLFSLQVSVGIPFLSGKYKNWKRLICLLVLFFTFSRTGFAISLVVVLIQTYTENRRLFVRAIVPTAFVFLLALAFTTIGGAMLEKMTNVLFVLVSPTDSVQINPSDLGRLAYAAVTIENLQSVHELVLGHGIKTNQEIIAASLDTSSWGLSDEMGIATVHNVYLEILSDLGLIGLATFLTFLCYSAYKIFSKFGMRSAHGLSVQVFIFSYLFEANYVTFFFQFFICYFLWIASASPSPRITSVKPLPRQPISLEPIAEASLSDDVAGEVGGWHVHTILPAQSKPK